MMIMMMMMIIIIIMMMMIYNDNKQYDCIALKIQFNVAHQCQS